MSSSCSPPFFRQCFPLTCLARLDDEPAPGVLPPLSPAPSVGVDIPGFYEGAGSASAGLHVSAAGICLWSHSPDLVAFYKFVAPNKPMFESASDYVLLSLS